MNYYLRLKQFVEIVEFKNIYNIKQIKQQILNLMSSPRKNIHIEKQTTMFGELLAIEKQTTLLTEHMIRDIEKIKNLQSQFGSLERQAKISTNESAQKATEEIHGFEERIKNYLIAQKAEYMRFSNQINQMIGTSKEINAQLTLLGNRFDQFNKNVGI